LYFDCHGNLQCSRHGTVELEPEDGNMRRRGAMTNIQGPTMGELNYSVLPPHIRAGFKSYIEDHRLPGDFITACLENSLSGAFGTADEINRPRLYDIVSFLYNEAPSECWGSREKVKAWVKEGKS
jgi:hypothetical protein